jgi:hypothetical protein
MPSLNVVPPNLPSAPSQYEPRYQDQFSNILRLFFNTVTNRVNAPLPHGSFYDTTTQTNPVASAVNLMSFNSIYNTAGSTIYGVKKDVSRVYVTQTGVYNIAFSAQLDKTGGGSATTFIWLRINGQSLAHSATKMVISGPNDEKVAAWNWTVTLAENDYFEIAWQSPDTAMVLLAEVASGNVPEIPSVIVTVAWISAINL